MEEKTKMHIIIEDQDKEAVTTVTTTKQQNPTIYIITTTISTNLISLMWRPGDTSYLAFMSLQKQRGRRRLVDFPDIGIAVTGAAQ